MKINLTVEEANKHLSVYFSGILGEKVTVTVDADPLSDNKQFIAYMALRNRHKPESLGYNKIQFIKDLRQEIPGMGLADAKYCVESSIETVRRVLIRYHTLVDFSVNMNRL